MLDFELHNGLYPLLTNSGAYYCVSSNEGNPMRTLLRNLLKAGGQEALQEDRLRLWCEQGDLHSCSELLHQAQQLDWLQGSDQAAVWPEQSLEQALTEILPKLGSEGKVILSDSEGLYVGCAGYNHETALELAALSADIANLHERHQGLISGNLKLDQSSWGLMDSLGSSRLGFWPLHIGSERFVLAIDERPVLNHPDFVRLLTILSRRYA